MVVFASMLSPLWGEMALQAIDLKGTIEVGRSEGGKWMPLPSSNVFVILKPKQSHAFEAPKAKTLVVDMFEKRFLTRHMVVNVGDQVDFRNLDHFNHNVFSLSKELTFDLGS